MIVRVRNITESEYDEASSLVMQVFREKVAESMETEGAAVFDAFASADTIRARDLGGAKTYIAEENGRLVGVLQVGEEGHVMLFFTCSDYHGKGVGRALIDVAEESHSLHTVNSSIVAVKAYERFGFSVCGQEQVQNGIRFIPMARAARED